MNGWRARLGVLVPSSIVATESEFNKMAPDGVVCHFHRFLFLGDRAGLAPGEQGEASRMIEELRGVGELAVDAVQMLCHVNPSAIGMA
jgi:maleate cis-trans isomerase